MSSVLIVEPDRQIRNFIAGILADFGHQVRQCRDAGEAEHWLGRARFDVLATDLALDFSILAQRVPVLTLSGRRLHPVAGQHQRPRRLNDKPFRFADLRMLVAAVGEIAPPYALAA